MFKTSLRYLGLLVAVAVLTAACGSDADEETSSTINWDGFNQACTKTASSLSEEQIRDGQAADSPMITSICSCTERQAASSFSVQELERIDSKLVDGDDLPEAMIDIVADCVVSETDL